MRIGKLMETFKNRTPTAREIAKYVLKNPNREKSRACYLYSTYTVIPIPCYSLHVASLGRFRHGSMPSNYSRAKYFHEAEWSKTPKRAAWVRVKSQSTVKVSKETWIQFWGLYNSPVFHCLMCKNGYFSS